MQLWFSLENDAEPDLKMSFWVTESGLAFLFSETLFHLWSSNPLKGSYSIFILHSPMADASALFTKHFSISSIYFLILPLFSLIQQSAFRIWVHLIVLLLGLFYRWGTETQEYEGQMYPLTQHPDFKTYNINEVRINVMAPSGLELYEKTGY